ncbi:hypothetical protein TW81_11645 [Vibrio galatheae]|uniref:Curlin subunit CsgB n=1 Tax=Vibrio galatheae TaxID=579748 RepID=A0A0F4NLD0_9VIBR|nr:hypothetical protein [Vibrio galatheae]KJY82856.1 hypothetical protein TW81_11645 [Vibrio galatheae]
MQNLKFIRNGFVVLSILTTASAYSGSQLDVDEMSNIFGEFQGSDELGLLEDLVLSPGNYAEVTLTSTSNSHVAIGQVRKGNGTNKAKVIQDGAHSSTAIVTQIGSSNTALVEQSGENNIAVLEQTGRYHTGYISQDGNNNLAYLNQCSGRFCLGNEGSEISISQANDNNVAIVLDKSNASYGIEQSGNDFIFIRNSMNRSIYVEQ